MDNCGTREENAVVAAHAQVQQLHLLQHPVKKENTIPVLSVKNAVAERKHTRISSDMSDP
uniref:Uncharacterized protein n=1 Tax=Oryza rufipogon TaxID=4529 RepID=A0A0E0R3J1_ORYRU